MIADLSLQRTNLPVHGSSCEMADNSLSPLQAFLSAALILYLIFLSLLKSVMPIGLITFPSQLCNSGTGSPIWPTDLPTKASGRLLLLCLLAIVVPDGLILL